MSLQYIKNKKKKGIIFPTYSSGKDKTKNKSTVNAYTYTH